MPTSAQQNALWSLFNPNSVAVIGASTSEEKIGNRICRQLKEEKFPGRIIPVNARGGKVAGIESITSIRECTVPVDVAVVTTSTDQTLNAVRDCAAMGVKFVIIHTAGFSEIGAEGRRIEQEIVATARAAGTRVVGPNCMQVYNPESRLNLIGTPFPTGNIGVISQSGNLIRALSEDFENLGAGFSKFVSIGNQADLGIDEYLSYLNDDDATRAIIIYVEGFKPGTGRRLIDVAAEVVRHKPILLVKGGRSPAGSRSAVSHTGSLAGERRIINAAMHQAGILIAERFDEAAAIAQALAQLPVPEGRRIAVVGGGGGHATICADALQTYGLDVPVFTEGTQRKIRTHLPERASAVNPVDFTGASEQEIAVYAKVPELALDDGMSGALLYGLYAGYRTDLERPGNTYEDTSRLIVDLVRRSGKPVVMQTVYARHPHPSLDVLRKGGVPVTDSVEHAARCLAALCDYGEIRRRRYSPVAATNLATGSLDNDLLARVRTRPARNLTEAESMDVLDRAGIQTPLRRRAQNENDAVRAAEEIGYPVALKTLSPDVVHKSESGAVFLDLRTADDVRAAYVQTEAIAGGEVLVSSFLRGGLEFIVGSFRDATFGPVLMFGLGGIWAELFEDVSFRILPIGPENAAEMIDEIKASALLDGYRGGPMRDRQAIVDILMRVGDFMLANPSVQELDLNPVLSMVDGAVPVDARIICEEEKVS